MRGHLQRAGTPSGPSGAPEEGTDLSWLREALDAVAALGQTFNADVGTVWNPGDVFEASKPALRRLADFQSMALFSVDEDGLGFELARAEPPELGELIRHEVQHQAKQGTFTWALYQDRAVLVPGKHMGRWVLLHVLSSPSRVLGMFVASSADENFFLPDMAQKILSILFQKCAGVLESGALNRELAEYNQNLENLIERRTEELRKSEEEARSANRAKSEFLAKMSHEIRTPINGVLGTNSLLLETELTAEQREYAETAGRSARNLLELVNDILDFSKIEAGQLSLEEVPFDLRGIAEEAVELLASKANEKGLELILRYRPGAPRHFLGDPGRVRQIILNLLSNALKFTQEGHVLLQIAGASEEGDASTVDIRVEDSGIGIEAENLKRVFEKFEQADTSTTRRFGGTGLGLAISRELAELMDGEIQAWSEPGIGSTFQVTLRLSPDSSREDTGIRFRPQSKHGALIVSCNPLLQDTLAEELEDLGVRASCISSVAEARKLMAAPGGSSACPSLLLLDSALGWESLEAFVRWVRQNGERDCRALVALTGGSGPPPQALSDELWDLILPKPVLERQIRKALRLLSDPGRNLEMPRTPSDGNGKKSFHGQVLLVEDDETNRLMAGAMLKKMGLEFQVAENGLEAVRAVETRPFDLILMDCQMPEMDGFQATAAIRDRGDDRSEIPILALTASVLEGDRDRCLKAGMDDYLTKPLTLDDLREGLAQWLPGGDSKEESGPEDPLGGLGGPDFDSAAALHRVGGNLDLLQEVGGIFFQAWEEREPALRSAIQNEDAKTLGDVAHKIKGSALNLSAPVVAEIAGELELLGLQLRVDEADPVVDRLVDAIQKFQIAFQDGLAMEEVST